MVSYYIFIVKCNFNVLSTYYIIEIYVYDFTAIQIKFGDREIRNIAHYNFEPMNKGYKYNYSGRLWLDYIRDSNTESTLKLDSYYSFENGLSSEINLKMFIPPLQDKVKYLYTIVVIQ